MTTLTDDPEPTPGEALDLLDDAINLLDWFVRAALTHRDQLPAEDESQRGSLAFIADLAAQAWANAKRARQALVDDIPAATMSAEPGRVRGLTRAADAPRCPTCRGVDHDARDPECIQHVWYALAYPSTLPMPKVQGA